MQNGERFLLLFNDLSLAITSFEKGLQIDLSKFEELEQDMLKNGQIQKFEYSIELLWKTLKKYFEVKRSTIVLYPKDAVKAFFAEEAIDEEVYLSLMDAIESRNFLSHIYKAEMFESIYPKLSNYAKAIRHACASIEPHTV